MSEMTGLAHGRLKVLYQGTFAEGRGLEEVLREWTGVDGTRIALFLRGPQNEWREALERLADELGLLGKSVYVLPPVLEKDLIGAAQEADIGLIPYKGDLPSYRFACPNKLSQYLHAGLAILANRIPFVEQTVARGQAGLCYDVDEPGSFARAVEALAGDRAGVERLRRNALEFAQNEYTWERYEDVLLALVEPR
jgi:glycosyltransferase involved in cell wall biosynthesis